MQWTALWAGSAGTRDMPLGKGLLRVWALSSMLTSRCVRCYQRPGADLRFSVAEFAWAPHRSRLACAEASKLLPEASARKSNELSGGCKGNATVSVHFGCYLRLSSLPWNVLAELRTKIPGTRAVQRYRARDKNNPEKIFITLKNFSGF